ncbi:CehA/McbA family metallohydrolase [Streptomyces racemochromogenes]|uniref:CehA/McbA family metallohydrolase n=1 Tax=Streptomyces racemochromogenes TaxID=67353 RepID=UPI0031EFDCF4
METLRLFTAAVQPAGGSHWTGHSLLPPPRPGTHGGPRRAHRTAAIHPVGRAVPRRGPGAAATRRAGGLVVPAHPHASCIGCAWKSGLAEADAVEVWNGVWTPDDEVSPASWDGLLCTGDAGRRLPALAHSDYHRDPDRLGGPQTVVLADDLSRGAIVAGLRSGRACAAESSAVSVEFTAVTPRGAHAGIGEALTAAGPAEEVLVRLSVTGAEGCDLRLVTDQGLVLTVSAATSLAWHTTPARTAHVRAEVRHPPQVSPLPGHPAALTSPVWLRS